ncbi:MAG TPA: NAD-dependent epimerase/dehydratase family protein [Marinagarivorans sp.]
MKILFIGGTGNISLTISQQLIASEHELTLYNRSSPLPGAKHIAGDINDEQDAQQKLHGLKWDVVVNWVGFTQEQAERDIRLFNGACQQYIYISSASCYQNPQPPLTEDRSLYITEERKLENPYWEYSRDKIAAEAALFLAYQELGFPVTVVRPSHTYSTIIPLTLGGWIYYNAVDRMKKGLPVVVQGDGTALWTLTHARDFAKGFIGLLGNTEAIGEAVHISSDEALDWNTIYQLTAAAVGATANIVHVTSEDICKLAPHETGSLLGDKTACALFDNSKIKRLVPGFKATIPFKEGIKETIEWFEADPSRQIINPEEEALIEKLVALSQR